MKKKRIAFLTLFFAMFVFSSCEKIDVEYGKYEYAVFCVLENKDTQVLRLWSTSGSEIKDDEVDIQLYKGRSAFGEPVGRFVHEEGDVYKLIHRPEYGKAYYLSIKIAGEHLTATTEMADNVSCQKYSYRYAPVSSSIGYYSSLFYEDQNRLTSSGKMRVWIYMTDPNEKMVPWIGITSEEFAPVIESQPSSPDCSASLPVWGQCAEHKYFIRADERLCDPRCLKREEWPRLEPAGNDMKTDFLNVKMNENDYLDKRGRYWTYGMGLFVTPLAKNVYGPFDVHGMNVSDSYDQYLSRAISQYAEKHEDMPDLDAIRMNYSGEYSNIRGKGIGLFGSAFNISGLRYEYEYCGYARD